ncbi:hypothetical protein JCM10908_000250 [Rhodotorula pacifica]|uniref:uncharacterized protein n=1 Tax=Rhodotorula pacifica TaxID=1495444 RepID=UPI003174EA32
MSSGCISCPDPIGPCPTCPSGQVCQQISQSCQTCAKRVCVADAGSSGKSGGGPSTGATVGGALGGILGVAAILAAVYFFWWRPRGLAASRKRYSQHLAKRNSRVAEKRKSGTAAGGAGDAPSTEDGSGAETDRATKRTSVHLNLGAPGDSSRRRNASPANGREGGALVSGRTSEDDDPFGDQDRSSIGTFNDASSIHESEFSFRSSRTNVIPIAYIPPHSSSVSIADAHRGAYGQSSDAGGLPPRSAAGLRASVPASMASRDSLALAGAELIELNPLPPVLTPDTPAVPHGATANGAPIRPPRSPGLDLNLPKISSPLAGGSSSLSNAGGSGNSSPTFLTPGTSAPGGRGMSVLMDQQPSSARARSAQSHLSTFTTRSGNSTMSYILDPPQIITPVSAQGVRRVELHQGQAGLVKIGAAGLPISAAATNGLAVPGGAASVPLPHSPTSPTISVGNAASVDPFDDANEEQRRLSGMASRDTLRKSVRPVSSATDTSRWTSSSFASDALEGGVQFLQGQTVTFTNPNSPMPPLAPSQRTVSGGSFDVPTSARSSEAFETGAASRALTNQNSAWSLATIKGSPSIPQAPSMAPSHSRDSATSVSTSGTHMSVLEGIPFLAPTESKHDNNGGSANDLPSSEPMGRQASTASAISLGLPVNVTATAGDASLSSSVASSTSLPPAAPPVPFATPSLGSRPATISSLHSASGDAPAEEEDEALPAPFLPFAGQRPTSAVSTASTLTSRNASAPATAAPSGRVQSSAISVRSGFGSGLSQIPFQLGFPSGFGEGEEDLDAGIDGDDQDGRRSMMSRDSRFPPSEAGDEDDDLLAGSSQDASLSASSTSVHTPETQDDPSDPFGAHAEIDHRPKSTASVLDPRASVDSFTLAMGLSADLDAQAAGQS